MIPTWPDFYTQFALALLTILSAAAGYGLRARSEKRKSLRQALYLLLELWHRQSASAANFSALLQGVIQRIEHRFPTAALADGQKQMLLSQVNDLLQQSVAKHMNTDYEMFSSEFAKIVRLVAFTDPVYAYRIEKISLGGQGLALTADYFARASELNVGNAGAEILDSMSAKATSKIKLDLLRELESDLRGLALRIGVRTYFEVLLTIHRRKRKIERGPETLSDGWLDSIIAPLIKEQMEAKKDAQPTA